MNDVSWLSYSFSYPGNTYSYVDEWWSFLVLYTLRFDETLFLLREQFRFPMIRQLRVTMLKAVESRWWLNSLKPRFSKFIAGANVLAPGWCQQLVTGYSRNRTITSCDLSCVNFFHQTIHSDWSITQPSICPWHVPLVAKILLYYRWW